MIGFSDNETVAAISVLGSVIVAGFGLVGVLLGRQNTRQHDSAAQERELDRKASEEYRSQLSASLDSLHTDVVQVRDILVTHVTDRDLHGG